MPVMELKVTPLIGTPLVGVPVGELRMLSAGCRAVEYSIWILPVLVILLNDNAVLGNVAHGDTSVGNAVVSRLVRVRVGVEWRKAMAHLLTEPVAPETVLMRTAWSELMTLLLAM